MTVAPLVGQQAQQIWKVFVGGNGEKGDNQRNLSCLPAPSLKQKTSEEKFFCEDFEPGCQVLPELVQGDEMFKQEVLVILES